MEKIIRPPSQLCSSCRALISEQTKCCSLQEVWSTHTHTHAKWDRFTHTRRLRNSHTAQCATSSSPAAPSLNLFTLRAGSRHCALFLFVMVITLSLTVPHFACHLTFTLFSLFLYFFSMYCQISWRMFKVLPRIIPRSCNPLLYTAFLSFMYIYTPHTHTHAGFRFTLEWWCRG